MNTMVGSRITVALCVIGSVLIIQNDLVIASEWSLQLIRPEQRQKREILKEQHLDIPGNDLVLENDAICEIKQKLIEWPQRDYPHMRATLCIETSLKFMSFIEMSWLWTLTFFQNADAPVTVVWYFCAAKMLTRWRKNEITSYLSIHWPV